MLRHSYATRLIDNGVSVNIVQQALGHRALATTSRYLHVSDARMRAELRRGLDLAAGRERAPAAAQPEAMSNRRAGLLPRRAAS